MAVEWPASARRGMSAAHGGGAGPPSGLVTPTTPKNPTVENETVGIISAPPALSVVAVADTV